jgi:predicted KAP-like P-loop ATPase
MDSDPNRAEGNNLGELSLEEAQELLRAKRIERMQQFQKELEALQIKYRCRLDPVVTIRGGQIMTQIEIVPLDEV